MTRRPPMRPATGTVLHLARPVGLALLAALAAAVGTAGTDSFRDPLDSPAAPTRLVAATHTTGVARAGNRRTVAVGVRGLIVASDDEGSTWRQVPAPVSSDLLAVHFVSPKLGWIGGHDGVVLVSHDGGQTWTKALDGRKAGPMLIEHLAALTAAGVAQAPYLLRETKRNFENGPEMPVLDVWFDDAQRGWAVGAFGTIVGTLDGGRTWQSWVERVDNPRMLHYHAITAIDGDVYVPSEQGVVFKLDRARHRFEAMQTGYAGSFFGVVGTDRFVLAYGLRGTIYRSRDRGATWERVPTDLPATLTAATVLADGRVLMVSQDGRAILTSDEATSFQALRPVRPTLFTDVVQVSDDRVVLAGLSGLQVLQLD